METKQKLRNIKDGPFCFQNKETLRFINKIYQKSSKKLRTARSIYLAFSELVSNQSNQNYCQATRRQIGKMAGVSSSSIDRYVRDFIKHGIIQKENRKVDKGWLSNKWYLLPFVSHHNYGDSTTTSNKDSTSNNNEGSNQDKNEVKEEHKLEEQKKKKAFESFRKEVIRKGIVNPKNRSYVAKNRSRLKMATKWQQKRRKMAKKFFYRARLINGV